MTHNNEEKLKNILEKVQGLNESEISGNVYTYFYLGLGSNYWVGLLLIMRNADVGLGNIVAEYCTKPFKPAKSPLQTLPITNEAVSLKPKKWARPTKTKSHK